MYLKYKDQSWSINPCNEGLIAQAASFDSSTWYYDSFATPAPGIGEGWLGGRLCLWLIKSIGQTPRNMMITIGENWVVQTRTQEPKGRFCTDSIPDWREVKWFELHLYTSAIFVGPNCYQSFLGTFFVGWQIWHSIMRWMDINGIDHITSSAFFPKEICGQRQEVLDNPLDGKYPVDHLECINPVTNITKKFRNLRWRYWTV